MESRHVAYLFRLARVTLSEKGVSEADMGCSAAALSHNTLFRTRPNRVSLAVSA